MAIFRPGIFVMTAWAILFSGSAASSETEDPTTTEGPSPAPTIPEPVAPSKLLEWLPKCPDDWELKRSQGQTLYQSHIESHAVREYRVFRIPGKERALPTDVMVVTIRDTCGQGPLLKPFHKETTPGTGGDLSLGRWGEYPAILVRVSPRTQSLRLLIAGRFIVEMVYAHGNNNVRAIRPWLAGCNLAAMRAAKQDTRPPILKRIALEFVDELNPKRNRRYSTLSTPATETTADSTESPVPLDGPPAPESDGDENSSE